MISNSVIISFFIRAWGRAVRSYRTSILCLIITRIGGFFGVLWAGSGLKRFLIHYTEYPGFGMSAAISSVTSGRNFIFTATNSFIENSFFINYTKEGLDNLFRAFWALCEKSWIAGFVAGFFGEERDFCAQKPEKLFYVKYAPLYFAALAVLAGLYVLLDFSLFIIAAGALFGSVLVLYKTEIGVLLTAFLIPLVPTKIVLGLCAVSAMSFLIKTFITRTIPLKWGITDVFAALFALVLAYGVVVAYHRPSAAIVSATYILFVMFYFTAKNTLRTRKMIFAAVSLLAFAGLLVSLYGVYQQVSGDFTTAAWIDEAMFDEATGRVYSTLANPNVLGEYLLFIIPLAFAAFYYFNSSVYKAASLGIFGVSVLCMLFTQSRGAWLGLILAMAIFALIFDRKLIVFGIISLLFMPLILPDSIINRFLSIGNLSDSSTAYRVYIWQACLNMLRDIWPSGIGPGAESFRDVYQKYAFNAIYAPHSHNLFMQVIIDYGIFGLLAFLGLMTAFFRRSLAAVKASGKFTRAVLTALCAGMAGFLAQGMTDNVWYNYRIVAYFWFILALCGALAQIPGSSEKGDVQY